jgi:hypothetical protein
MGKLFDQSGDPLYSCWAKKGQRRYCYFVSKRLVRGTAKPDPEAGWKTVWNYEWRWQSFGFSCMAPATWDRVGGSHEVPKWELPPTDWMASARWTESGVHPALPTEAEVKMIYGGGGTFQRTLDASYRKVFYTHLAMLENHTLPVPGAANFEFKEFTGFYSSFDIRGTAFIIYRYADPHREDDGWAYIPNLRSVRRISAEVKSDSLLGTDHTLEDFYSFSGRELEWHWRFLGWKDQLAVQDSVHQYSYLYGPNGIIPNDLHVCSSDIALSVSFSSKSPESAWLRVCLPERTETIYGRQNS